MAELEKKKHEKFCQEYIVDLNGTQAAIRAGYKEANAASQASTLLRNPNILARVGELRKEQRERLALNADFVVLELIDTYKKCKNPTGSCLWDFFILLRLFPDGSPRPGLREAPGGGSGCA